MRNIRLTLEYDGTNYHGFQRQKNARTIQEVLEEALHKILKERVSLVSSGRTDSKVHALEHIVNFRTKSGILPARLQPALNSLLPVDIVVKDAQPVSLKFHSQFDAESKLYRYTILNRRYGSAFYRKYAWLLNVKMDLKLMKREARALVGRHDFKAFQASGAKEGPTVRTIKALDITRSCDFVYIDIEADGFLYNMVRSITGTLVDIGRGRLSKGTMKRILEKKDRRLIGQTAPAKGLCLIKVKY